MNNDMTEKQENFDMKQQAIPSLRDKILKIVTEISVCSVPDCTG